ncbi:uncharacterized protein K489DRAFT_93754 [Dissoconium aciculare CBS 342.82]|uniref:Uncharacterized protein n=1 Tax=Dissoconium aciculare CBS 342.82 TaxID=1314786 RepID=A0A6J3LRG4_9PEZI|nr:uncharacterized protein K489DRAFT_93754 [Dissoconium aciculare CBS 342.82]KAF1818425.1 hypothetical protein K489DRAFT_93754 [Dissoconium aciculare CBS 342.82]
MDDALQALQEWKVYDQSASARTAGELEQWFDYYSNTNIPWLIPGSDRESINDELDEAKIDRQVVATAKGCSVSDGLCLCCTSILSTVNQELSLHRPYPWKIVEPTNIGSDSEWVYSKVDQDHDSKSIEAGSRNGCRLCVLLFRNLKNDRVLNALRSIEDRLERLDKLNDSSKATQSLVRCMLRAEFTINSATPFALRFYCPRAMHGAQSSYPIITLDVWGRRGWCKLSRIPLGWIHILTIF